MVTARKDEEQGKRCGVAHPWTRVLCVSISQHAVLRSMRCYKQVTLSTSETSVKEGLRRNYYMMALLSQFALRRTTGMCCEGLFCSRRRTKYHSGDFCGRSLSRDSVRRALDRGP